MAKYPGLVKRGVRGVYQFRRRVPTALVPSLGKRELIVSLNTVDRDTAIERSAREDAKARKLFRAPKSQVGEPNASAIRARSGDTFETIDEACDYFYRLNVKIEQDFRVEHTRHAFEDVDAFWSGQVIPLPEQLPSDRNGLALVLAQAYRERLQVEQSSKRASPSLI